MTESKIQQTLTSAEVRQAPLADIEASKQTIAELNDEQLEDVAGGGYISNVRETYRAHRDLGRSSLGSMTQSVKAPVGYNRVMNDATI